MKKVLYNVISKTDDSGTRATGFWNSIFGD